MLTVTMNDCSRDDRDAAARIAALLPAMESRYRQLHDTLSRALGGEDIPDWQLDLHRNDLLAVLDAMSPGALEDGER